MAVSMMDVRQMRMLMCHGLMCVAMGMGLRPLAAIVLMQVMFVTHMLVFMRQNLMRMFVFVGFSQHNPGGKHHQAQGQKKGNR